MSQSGATILWPFAGRIFRTIGNVKLACPWICRRSGTHPHDSDRRLSEPLELRAHTISDELEFPLAVRALLRPFRAPGAPASGALLGRETGSQLTAREGLLLSEWIFQQLGITQELAATDAADVMIIPLHHATLDKALVALDARLRAGTARLSGLAWPLQPQPAEHVITAATLPMWRYDLATDFAAFIAAPPGAGQEHRLLCDLRVQETRTHRRPPPPRAPPPAPELPSPPHRKRGGAPSHPANAWLRRAIIRCLDSGELGPTTLSTARGLIIAWQEAHPGQTPPRDRAIRELIRRVRKHVHNAGTKVTN